MKRLFGIALAFALGLVSAASLAQTQTTTPREGSEAKVPPGGRMETESTTKHTGPGPNTKTKTQMVVGTVKEYEASKKIVVTGPKNKDYSFDLDENAGVTGDIAVGKKVKVTYTKSDGGQKVTTVAPYTAKTKTKKKAKAA